MYKNIFKKSNKKYLWMSKIHLTTNQCIDDAGVEQNFDTKHKNHRLQNYSKVRPDSWQHKFHATNTKSIL